MFRWIHGDRWSVEKLKREYPVVICGQIRSSSDGSRIAILNMFEKNTRLYELADPKLLERPRGMRTFFHTFLASDAVKAREFLNAFAESGQASEPYAVRLFRWDYDLQMYAYGHICPNRIKDQDGLREILPESAKIWNNVFVLPLKCYLFECPVCHQRTLPYRGWNMICTECGWEDEGTDDEDAPTGSNEGDSIRTYRELRYLPKKEKDPNYTWEGQFERRKKAGTGDV